MTANAKESIESLAETQGITMSAKFVPWSLSRNAGEKMPSLNWKVSILLHGREILTTDYMAGCGHYPSYGRELSALSVAENLAIKSECETGKYCGKAIMPELADVLSSLMSDASAIDYDSFESWAEDNGYNTDSRKAETIYRTCLEIALKLRAALGEKGLAEMQKTCAEY